MPLGSSLGTARSPWRFWWCWAAPCSSAAAAARAQAKGKAASKRVRLPAEGDVAGGHRPQTGADAAVAGTACADVAASPMRTMCCGSRSTVVSTVLNRTCSCYDLPRLARCRAFSAACHVKPPVFYDPTAARPFQRKRNSKRIKGRARRARDAPVLDLERQLPG